METSNRSTTTNAHPTSHCLLTRSLMTCGWDEKIFYERRSSSIWSCNVSLRIVWWWCHLSSPSYQRWKSIFSRIVPVALLLLSNLSSLYTVTRDLLPSIWRLRLIIFELNSSMRRWQGHMRPALIVWYVLWWLSNIDAPSPALCILTPL
jgi:hypothetical protein